ncbi:hypothetical protein HNR42_000814 [Deinobacterium chartae]|uniref:Uncharacterized protein n=1 Tax=Deinobacterium chartae TaxID=521158 RepID=A0A841HYV8_9DEIO|nr:hypothetical protein [Deinobacterium chartae]MBB6097400.1 hypothetical protein [Deinobacterium chartae]
MSYRTPLLQALVVVAATFILSTLTSGILGSQLDLRDLATAGMASLGTAVLYLVAHTIGSRFG